MHEKKQVRCIFCGEYKEGSREHIIPEALENCSLVINNVCTKCNNRLGSEIDAPFVDDFLVRMLRKALGIKGKQNSLPDVISGTYKVEGGRKIRVDDEGHWSLLPAVIEEDGIVYASASSEAESLRVIEKNVKRRLQREEIEWTEHTRSVLMKHQRITQQLFSPPETLPQCIDFRAISFGVLKVAYEYGSSILGENYFNDELAKTYRSILNDPSAASFAETQRYVHHVLAPKEMVIPWTDKCHVLCLITVEHAIVMNFTLFGSHAWNFQFLISDHASNYRFLSPHCDIVIIKAETGET